MGTTYMPLTGDVMLCIVAAKTDSPPKKTKAKAGKVTSMYFYLWNCIWYC